MADSRQSSAGVKNLRAMFENSAPTSPDSRGRSVSGNSSNDSNERPLSKVRSSFYAVEPTNNTAKMNKSPPTGSPSANIKDRERRESFSLSEENDAQVIEEIHQTISQEEEARRKSENIVEVVPEQAVETAPPTAVPTPLLAAIKKPSPPTSEHITQQNSKKMTTKSSPATPKMEEQSRPAPEPEADQLQQQQQPVTPNPPQQNRNGRKSDAIEPWIRATGPPSSPIPPTFDGSSEQDPPESSESLKQREESKTPKTTASVPSTSKNISASTRTPSNSRTTKSTTRTRTPSTQSNGARDRQTSQTRSTRSSLASNTTLPGNLDRGVGFVKPRPRSPTRPITLPAHLVAPTASSASKVRGAEDNSNDRVAGVKSPISPRANGTTSLRSSTSSFRSPPKPRVRNAWGPPPQKKKSPEKKEEKKEEKHVDSSFLARMMRPTASSAAKEKGAKE